jgi:chromate transport protein ChrA
MSEKYGWFTHEQLTNMIAISESTPGPIGVNIATYVGFSAKNYGVLGAIVSTLGLILPSLIVILIIAGLLQKFKENHQGCLNCVDLLRQNKEAGGNKKAHCDACVYECVKLVEELL